MSFVWGEDNVNFLRARYAALQQSELFRGIRYSEDHQQIKAWAPLVMEGRDPLQKGRRHSLRSGNRRQLW